jgi:hypothetical protein
VIQGTFGVIQGTFGVILGTFATMKLIALAIVTQSSSRMHTSYYFIWQAYAQQEDFRDCNTHTQTQA